MHNTIVKWYDTLQLNDWRRAGLGYSYKQFVYLTSFLSVCSVCKSNDVLSFESWGKAEHWESAVCETESCHFSQARCVYQSKEWNILKYKILCIDTYQQSSITWVTLYTLLINGARSELHGQGYFETRLGRPLLWHFCTSHSEVAADQPRKCQEYHSRRVQQVSWSWQPLQSSWSLPSRVSKSSCPSRCHLWV